MLLYSYVFIYFLSISCAVRAFILLQCLFPFRLRDSAAVFMTTLHFLNCNFRGSFSLFECGFQAADSFAVKHLSLRPISCFSRAGCSARCFYIILTPMMPAVQPTTRRDWCTTTGTGAPANSLSADTVIRSLFSFPDIVAESRQRTEARVLVAHLS